MDKLIAILLTALAVSPAFAKGGGGHAGGHGHSHSHTPAQGSTANSHSFRGHVRSDGTYVQPHHATNPDATRTNNWSTRPNVNPYTGQEGAKSPN